MLTAKVSISIPAVAIQEINRWPFVPLGVKVSRTRNQDSYVQRTERVLLLPDSGKLCSFDGMGTEIAVFISVNLEMKNLLIPREQSGIGSFIPTGNGDMETWTFIRCFVRFHNLKTFGESVTICMSIP